VSGILGSNHGRQRRNRPGPCRRFRRRPTPAARRPRRADIDRTTRPPSRNRQPRCVSADRSTRPVAGHHGGKRPPQRSHCRWPLCVTGSDTDRDAARVANTCCPQSGQRTGRCPPAERPADMTVEAAAEGPQRFRPGGGNGTGCRTPDRSRSHPAWTPRPPAGRRGRTGQDAASSGRSIRRSFRLVTTSSTLPQGRPRPAATDHPVQGLTAREAEPHFMGMN
jgi:hypothetical protein